jgi:proteasome lid subunit RPN8/RPN11
MNETTRAAILAHAEKDYPRESCGLIVNARGHERYLPCGNVALSDEHFALDPRDCFEAEDRHDVLAVVHSHPDAPAFLPSEADRIIDRVGCERSGLPWVIVGWPGADMLTITPEGYVAPLLGRQFVYGVLDCYTLMQDWYRQELKIDVPKPPREADRPDWWKRGPNGEPPHDLYLEGFEAAGFSLVEHLERGDVILIQLQADVANHCAIYLGDQVILHHVWGRLSCREVYGGYWMKNTRAIVRHRSLLPNGRA